MYKTIVINTRSTDWTNKESGEEMIVDAEDLAQEMDKQINQMAGEGFELVQITPLNSGNIANANGYLHTSSMVLTFKK
jgi:hypothetical protein